jgi:hypothetical protein
MFFVTVGNPRTPCVRLVIASKDQFFNFRGIHESKLFSRIYRAGLGQGIFARRPDREVGRGTERQLPHVKELDEESLGEAEPQIVDERETPARLECGRATDGLTGKPRTVR